MALSTGNDLRASALRLGAYSFLILFFELALIRYVPAYVRVFAFYLNLVLIATFLGMGVGLLRAELAGRLRWLAVPAVLLLFGAVKFFSNVIVETPADPDHFVWGVLIELSPHVRRAGILPVAALLFALCALFFVPLGALLGAEFRKFRALTAYSIDIGGSLLGILTFALFSAFRTPPALWFAFGFALWIGLSLRDRRFAGTLAGALAAAWALTLWTAQPRPEYWSPYYRINVFASAERTSLHVNGAFHQAMVHLDTATARRSPVVREIRSAYLRPFQWVPRMDTALVVGAGTGNDVALLLEMGARHVDAVEIDPVILDLGRAGHPRDPYADPRVRAHVDDARAFLRKSDRTYDVIVFGTLDSHSLLSGMSSLRLDNYVYTREAFRDARDRLKPAGALITYHMSGRDWIAAKIRGLLADAFGHDPIVLPEPSALLFNHTFVTSRAGARAHAGAAVEPVPPVPPLDADVALPTDDWPYLYLRRPAVPAHYRDALAAILLISLLFVGAAAPRALRSGVDAPMFFLGVGFLLVETKSVTEMSLLFGSTWIVNLLVFSSILVMILAANLLVIRRPPRSVRAPFLALFASLAAAYAVPARSLLWLGHVGGWIVGGLMVALPIFFAAVIFATLFRARVDTTRALAYNLLGAVFGGVLEYGSLAVGIKGLYLVAAAAYLAVLVALARAGPVVALDADSAV